MASLFIVAESEGDEFFYDLLIEKAARCTFDRPDRTRLRQGSNWKTALAAARLLLSTFKGFSRTQEIAIVIAVDNDRAPGHPGSSPPPRPLLGMDRKKHPRYPEVLEMLHEAFGSIRETWPVDVAVAMPVEMKESWLLLLHNPARPALPIFAEAAQPSARAYYGGAPPPQLKDLCEIEAAARGEALPEFAWKAAEQDIDAAASVSRSLKMFVDEVRQWRTATKAPAKPE